MTGSSTLSPELVGAVQELRATFSDSEIRVSPDEQGGAWVLIDPIDLGGRWAPRQTWLGFHLAANYPYADIYPLFIAAECCLTEEGDLPPAVSTGASIPICDGPCVQISRRSNGWDPTRDTAAIKAVKVRDWLAAS